MAKTACEEAAEQLDQGSDLCKRLRAEGRELKRLRKLFAAGATVDRGIGFRGVLAQNRIQKAGKK